MLVLPWHVVVEMWMEGDDMVGEQDRRLVERCRAWHLTLSWPTQRIHGISLEIDQRDADGDMDGG